MKARRITLILILVAFSLLIGGRAFGGDDFLACEKADNPCKRAVLAAVKAASSTIHYAVPSNSLQCGELIDSIRAAIDKGVKVYGQTSRHMSYWVIDSKLCFWGTWLPNDRKDLADLARAANPELASYLARKIQNGFVEFGQAPPNPCFKVQGNQVCARFPENEAYNYWNKWCLPDSTLDVYTGELSFGTVASLISFRKNKIRVRLETVASLKGSDMIKELQENGVQIRYAEQGKAKYLRKRLVVDENIVIGNPTEAIFLIVKPQAQKKTVGKNAKSTKSIRSVFESISGFVKHLLNFVNKKKGDSP
jgi:predicted peroxiredoxin